ncbi:hypothetical protein D1839_11555 [Roseburia sp. 1XD42-34]|nr:hypothetical protein [Roseburia sp. 1XD42-34]RKI77276.1 hypothetical protein D7V87_11540 [Clostridium sp. 1xD42-85]
MMNYRRAMRELASLLGIEAGRGYCVKFVSPKQPFLCFLIVQKKLAKNQERFASCFLSRTSFLLML